MTYDLQLDNVAIMLYCFQFLTGCEGWEKLTKSTPIVLKKFSLNEFSYQEEEVNHQSLVWLYDVINRQSALVTTLTYSISEEQT